MIVVIGSAAHRAGEDGRPDGVAGRAPAIARAAVEAGSRVELVARLGEDVEGDAVLLALAGDGVGHVAVLRDAGARTRVATTPTAPDTSELDLLLDDAGADPFDTPGPALRAADIELALRYLSDTSVIVAADPLDPDSVATVTAATDFARAHLIVVSGPPGSAADGDVPGLARDGNVTVLEAPASDPDGAFASFVGRYAAALEGGANAADAFSEARREIGWAAVESNPD